MYSDIIEIREVKATVANALLAQGWRILEIKTVREKSYVNTVNTRWGFLTRDEFTPVYDETETVVYIVGKPADAQK
jgi:hypothetical protein